MQIKIKKLLVVLLAFVLLGIGCMTETPQNDAINKNNQNSSNQNASDQNSSANTTPPPACKSVSEEQLKAEINKLPAQLRDQFKEVNPQTGTISLNYKAPALTFNGYITGMASNLSQLINTYDKFRGEDCVRIVYFEGATASEDFEWRPEKLPKPPEDCKKSVDDIINNSSVKDQINKNLFYDYDKKEPKVLFFSGHIDDKPSSNGRFTSLLAQLNQPMINGCISKIVFAKDTKLAPKPMAEAAFSWQICEGGLVECKGECVNPPCSGV